MGKFSGIERLSNKRKPRLVEQSDVSKSIAVVASALIELFDRMSCFVGLIPRFKMYVRRFLTHAMTVSEVLEYRTGYRAN